jgi:branched-chain amino acid transport system substrate-binding protein
MKRVVVFTLLIIFAVMLAACGGAAAPEAESGPIKVGAIFDLSGPTAGPGAPYSEGMKAYVDWKNKSGGIEGRQIELVSQDYAYQVPNAEQLYSQFVSQDNVVVFQGWGTGDTEALRGKIAEDKIPFMSASYSINLAREEAPYNFLVGTSYSDQMVIALQWIKDQGGSKVTLLHHDSPFGQSPLPDGQEFADANGMELLAVAMPGGATDLTPQLTQINDFGAEYIIVQNVSSPAALAMRNAKDLGMEAKFICLNWCADEILVELAGDAAEGVVGTMPFTPPTVDVAGDDEPRKYAEANTDKSLDEWGVHYAQGWWTMAIMHEGVDRVIKEGKEVTGENIKAALEGLQNFDTGGISAPISFSAEDHRGNKALRLFQVNGGKWEQISDYIESDITIQ